MFREETRGGLRGGVEDPGDVDGTTDLVFDPGEAGERAGEGGGVAWPKLRGFALVMAGLTGRGHESTRRLRGTRRTASPSGIRGGVRGF